MTTADTPTVIHRLTAARMVPVIVLDHADDADPLADALITGGIACAEITLRTPAGLHAIRRLAQRGDILVGAGTCIDRNDVDAAVDAGAEFIVSPGYSQEVVSRAREREVTVIPGVATATELQAAALDGITTAKLFPIELLGGPDLVSALAGPFPHITFMPSGGITLDMAARYLSHPAVFAIGGSWVASRRQIAAGEFAAITAMAARTATTLGIEGHRAGGH